MKHKDAETFLHTTDHHLTGYTIQQSPWHSLEAARGRIGPQEGTVPEARVHPKARSSGYTCGAHISTLDDVVCKRKGHTSPELLPWADNPNFQTVPASEHPSTLAWTAGSEVPRHGCS